MAKRRVGRYPKAFKQLAGERLKLRKEVSQWKRLLADKTLEVDFFKGAWHNVEARCQRSGGAGATASQPYPGRDVVARQLGIERMCHLAPVSRAGFYRSLQEPQPVEEDLDVRSAIQQIAVAHRRRYGYRRITAELRRRGLRVNHKRVLGLMREDTRLPGRCANSKLAHQRGSPHAPVLNLC